jgi:serine/threonine protein kinase/Tol biopolymer transport system component
MPLSAGTRLGPYEILAPLGSGGMGEVYRARDSRLGRDVAIKVLPQHLNASPEVRARFEREARTVSSLNHPSICTLFDVGREGDTDYLVMELIEGETLAQKLQKGALPAADVLKLGAQIADALDRAHRAGVIHRDLKPGNVMLTKSGAKLMDFGLARATGLAGPAGASGATVLAMTQSPTMAAPLTAEGTIVGTFQYMSPEQLEGKEADARSDIWALGCVLYEMATGARAFEGATQASLIGAIMRDVLRPMSQLAPMSPPGLERLVLQCVAKDPEERWQSAGDIRRELDWVASGSSAAAMPAVGARRRVSRERLAWSLVAALVVLLAGVTLFVLRAPRGAARNMHVTLPAPETAMIDDDDANVRISPDGHAVTFIATDSSGASQLWMRELSEPAARPLPGTQQANLPFWSPDSRFIGFFADGKLKKVDLAGRNVQILCDAPDGRGGTWSPRGVIVFAPASTGPLQRVSAGGGVAAVATVLDTTLREEGHRFPSFLPDGNHFLYLSMTGGDSLATRLASLSDRATKWVISAEGVAVYAPPGFLLYVRSGAILAERFEPGAARPNGEPRVLAPTPNGSRFTGAPPFSVSQEGVLVERHRTLGVRGMGWLDRGGRRIGEVPVPAASYGDLTLSPDDRQIALTQFSSQGSVDVWTIDLARGISNRLTSDLVFCEKPLWSPDGRWVAFSALTAGKRKLYRKLATGAGDAEVLWEGRTTFTDPASWSGDGRTLVFRDLDPKTGEDIWRLPLEGERRPAPLLHSTSHEEDANLSPDGHWLSYRSNESGRAELYVQSFPTPEAKFRISTEGGGTQSRSNLGKAFWRRDGRELVYVGGDGVTVLSVPVEIAGGFHAGTPRPLFRLPAGCVELVPTSDLQRFLVLEDRSTKESGSIQMIVDWPAELKER